MSQTTALTTEALVTILDKKLEEKLRPFHQAMDDLKQSVDFVSAEFDSLTHRVSDVEEKCKDVLTENIFLKAEVLRLSNAIKQHSETMSNIEQCSWRDCIEISGIPEEPGEDTNELTIKVGSLMGLNIDKNDISVSHRLPTKGQLQSCSSRLRPRAGAVSNAVSQHPRIIVKFVRRDIKDVFYSGRRHSKDKTTRDIGLSRSSVNQYISESLTPRNRTLFNECLKFKKEHNYKYIWTQNGRIYLRRNGEKPSNVISCNQDLDGLSR